MATVCQGIYSEEGYHLQDCLVDKLGIMIDRMTGKKKFDNVIIIDGDEGHGKSTLAIQICGYVAAKTGRAFPRDCSRIFFDANAMTEFAKSHDDQIILWDEAALGGLTTESYNKVQVRLLQLLMVARKKRHFYIFNIPKFFRLKEQIIERAVALIHVYARNEVDLGYFTYYRKSAKAALYDEWKSSKKKVYYKYISYKGGFSDVFDLIVDEKIYDQMKDKAIMSIGTSDLKKKDYEYIRFRYRIASFEGVEKKELCEALQITPQLLASWKKLPEKYPGVFEITDEED